MTWTVDDDAITPRVEPALGDLVVCPETPDGRELDAFLRRAREGCGPDVYLDHLGEDVYRLERFPA